MANNKSNQNDEYIGDILMKERKRWGFFGIPWTFTVYTLTPKRLVLKEGLLKSTENEILLYRVIDIELSQTLFQKMFKLGTVTVKSKDASHPMLHIKNVKNSREFRNVLADSVEKERMRMRVRQGEVYDPEGSDVHDAFGDGY